ncbi:transcriptional regulation of mitochondrial recombination-domain-containing protein [Parachaetomium inaequale]|uniref:Large ribosomal subunit protein mL67 n=1 Tax=Parachaetomium inaequale TaxID=2588326 RepID=A0AAN6SQU4_9PEZI|nr:transcriptional regulation of mitochondrial recombination-domain-containing protein [Parachaetomium inaequale]
MNSLRPLPLLSSRLQVFSNAARTTTTTTIGVVVRRHASTEAAEAAAASVPAPPAAAATVAGVPATAVGGAQRISKKGPHRSRSVMPPGHAERIWVHNHIMANHTVYSLTPEMNSTKAFRQFVFTGKKNVPAALRKDYWRPLAIVEFASGKGDVGRSVFHKLRELKKRHQLEWDDARLLQMSKRERGAELNDQRGNFVADLAAVLAGRGKGNRVLASGGVKAGEKGVVEVVEGGDKVAEEGGEKKKKKKGVKKLHGATVYWANEQDKYYAEEWTDNVTHVIGLPERAVKKEAVVEEGAAPVETEAAAAAKAPTAETAEAAKTE